MGNNIEFVNSESDSDKKILDFPVVGIGASAGGLEALQEFFQTMTPTSGAAFVIIQHLSPDYKSFMNELLSRYTTMQIEVVKDGMDLKQNHVYLIPPKMNMTIFHGILYLNELSSTRTLNLPIDIFFRSLAKDQEKNAIAIILSGTGTDGTLGIRAIKEYGGMTMVQDDKSAKFDGMPRSSISTGMVDIVMPPKRLAEELMNYIRHPFVNQTKNIESQLFGEQNQLTKVVAILNDTKNVDFSGYKENTIIRRLEKRISINRFEKIEEYTKFLINNSKEINILFNELLIGVTRFFRDESFFNSLKSLVLARLLEDSSMKNEIRVWVSACSTGEEAYTLAMLFKEIMAENNIYREVKIFATDLDSNSLEFAANGLYPDNIVSDVSPERIAKYFIRKDNGYQINDSIRGMIIFARHNITSDPPFSKLDLISCRNLLIYLNNDVQQKILATFNLSLNEKGYLFLGSSESLGDMAEGFNVLELKAKIYQKKLNYKPKALLSFGNSSMYRARSEMMHVNTAYKPAKNKSRFLEGVFNEIMVHYLPPSVVVDEQHEVLHTINDVSRYLSIPMGQMSFNLLKMLSKEMSVMVSSILRRAQKSDAEIVFDTVDLKNRERKISISCKKIQDKLNDCAYYLVSFEEREVETTAKRNKKVEKVQVATHYNERIEELEKELQLKSENLQATVEELETSNEELQSSNEELVAANEELQSTNEELQSVNEELYTVNSEHIRKIDELTELNADFENLLKNTQIGNLYLDQNLTIRKINDVASKLTNILSSDIGRPLQHMSLNILYEGFLTDIEKVSDNLQPVEREVADQNNNWYLMRIIPYRTIENAVEGIIVTFVNITKLKQTQNLVSNISNRLERALDMGEMSWWEWDYDNNIVKTGPGKYAMLGYEKSEIGDGYIAWTNLVHPDDLAKTMLSMKAHLEDQADMYFVEYRIKHKDGHYLWYRDKGGIVSRNDQGRPKLLMGIVMNITKEKLNAEKYQSEINFTQTAILNSEVKYKLLHHNMAQGVVFQSPTGEILDANPAAEKLLGLTCDQLKGRFINHPQWNAINKDKTPFPASEHPTIRAATTRQACYNEIIGIYNPFLEKHIWIKITSIPIIHEMEQTVSQVYSLFYEIDNQ